MLIKFQALVCERLKAVRYLASIRRAPKLRVNFMKFTRQDLKFRRWYIALIGYA